MKRTLSLLLMLLMVVPMGATLAAPVDVEPTDFVWQDELDYPTLYEQTSPSVVYIEVDAGETDSFFSQNGLGSGFVYDTQGHIVTNYHVIDGAERITVTFFDGLQARAELVGTDPDSDLAVIRVNVPAEFLRPVQLADSTQLRVGEGVIAIGNPFGQNWTMTTGIVSAVGRSNRIETGFSIANMIQTDAAINPGNSGGPLLNLRGQVIGVNTMIFTETSVNSGVGFAVPSNTVRRVVPELITNGFYEYTWIGVSGGDMTLDLLTLLDLPIDTRGVLISRVSDGGPAEAANLRGSNQRQTIDGRTYEVGGDIIIAIDGTPITGISDLIGYLAENTRPGDVVNVTLIRNGAEVVVPVTLEARPNRAR